VPTGLTYRFGVFELDVDRAMLTKNGVEVSLRPKAFDVLRFLLRHQGMLVTREQLFDGVWPGVVVTPDSINQCIIEIRKALGDNKRKMLRTLPRRGYRFDFDVTVSGSNGNEATTFHTRQDNDIPGSKSQPRWPAVLIISLVAVALLYLLAAMEFHVPWRQVDTISDSLESVENPISAARDLSDRSIVVLPFLDLSTNSDQNYFALGLSEEMMQLLQRIPDLRVISQTSAFAFRDKNLTVTEIADQLGVTHVLEGSVRLDENRLRVTVQLINARDDKHLWAQSYDRELREIFDIQEEIAALVVRDLEVPLWSKLPRIQRTNPEAYALYLQSKVDVYTLEAINESIDKLREVLVIDPAYSVAWAALGRRYLFLYMNYGEPTDEALDLAQSLAEKALMLDPHCAPAYALLGALAVQKNSLSLAAMHFENALEFGAVESVGVGGLLQSLGRFEEALQYYRFYLLRNPLSGNAHGNYALTLVMARRLAEAETHYRQAMLLNPSGSLHIPVFYAMTLGFQGKYQEARDFLEGQEVTAGNKVGLTWLYQQLGMIEEYDRNLAELTQSMGASWHLDFARLYALLGDADAAFERLDALETFAHWNRERYWPIYWPIEHDPRWQKFLEKAGVSDAQLAEIEFNFRMLPVDYAGPVK
jgi:TolB-like protein/DNA-binding winged helix-turn-helix (wHTH) protein/Tfp pilus assembly protein PilF